MADAIREFNEYLRQDSRVDVVALPFRDGVSIVTRRYAHPLPTATIGMPHACSRLMCQAQDVSSHLLFALQHS